MADYRIYILDGRDYVIQRHELSCESDDGALERARAFVDGCDVEVWESYRRLARLTHKANAKGAPTKGV